MLEVVTIQTPALGDRSYLIYDGAEAVVVDPQRDIGRFWPSQRPGACGSRAFRAASRPAGVLTGGRYSRGRKGP
jgi:hypothetical protein